MIEIEKVVAGSNWDSGTHLGFFCGISEENQYSIKSLDWYLTKEQITSVEKLIAACVASFFIDKEKSK